MIANLKASRLTLLYGESGVGKSSILGAGVMRQLHAEVATNLARHQQAAAAMTGAVEGEMLATPFAKPPIAVALFREPWKDDPVPLVMAAVQRAVEEAAGESVPAWREGDDVVETLKTWTKTVRTILVVFDQFEEYFLYHPDDDGPETLAGALPAVVNEPDLRVNFMLSIREDSLAKLDRFKKDIPIFANVLRIHPLDKQAAADAIEEPLKRWKENGDGGYRAEPAFVTAVIDEVAARRGHDGGRRSSRRAPTGTRPTEPASPRRCCSSSSHESGTRSGRSARRC